MMYLMPEIDEMILIQKMLTDISGIQKLLKTLFPGFSQWYMAVYCIQIVCSDFSLQCNYGRGMHFY